MTFVDTHPTAESSYARTLIARGCSESLAVLAAEILARGETSQDWNSEEELIVAKAYAQLQ